MEGLGQDSVEANVERCSNLERTVFELDTKCQTSRKLATAGKKGNDCLLQDKKTKYNQQGIVSRTENRTSAELLCCIFGSLKELCDGVSK